MAKGDRVVVGTGYVWTETKKDDGRFELVMAYMPLLQEGGGNQETPDGGTVVKAQGGVVAGSTGTIQGTPVNVHRSYLHNARELTAGYGGRDFIQMIPILLDKYQQTGWFPVDNIRVVGGSSPS